MNPFLAIYLENNSGEQAKGRGWKTDYEKKKLSPFCLHIRKFQYSRENIDIPPRDAGEQQLSVPSVVTGV